MRLQYAPSQIVAVLLVADVLGGITGMIADELCEQRHAEQIWISQARTRAPGEGNRGAIRGINATVARRFLPARRQKFEWRAALPFLGCGVANPVFHFLWRRPVLVQPVDNAGLVAVLKILPDSFERMQPFYAFFF